MEPGGIQSNWIEPWWDPLEVLLRGTLRESLPGLMVPRASFDAAVTFEPQPNPSVAVQHPPSNIWCKPYEPTPDHVPDDDYWPGPDEICEWSRECSQLRHYANLAATVYTLPIRDLAGNVFVPPRDNRGNIS